ncbi:YeeE/YedE family protein [Beijerinckia indica]|uniref:Uncharacterized protein n=1 Tax=Beijerinckia indica subsp. indica (strain ATCC 9039 / DSM 1715 / NCIMB 8712) TaxID=395963 RepID=B2IFV9_BEII9|nr:YeeE/YedE family protein [Beijerinckia indica]ACB95698.1 protein of unknown function DUF395 YeeE/YedE [Beijerinckia indica subsp. indica ATCC 9039]
MSSYWYSLAGGLLIGLSAALLLLLNGRIAGISGIIGRLLGGDHLPANGAFLIGLILGPLVFKVFFGHAPDVTITEPWPLLIVAGLLVGFGTRLGSGCTSGHGVLGLARLSPRSFAAVVTFLIAGILTVFLLRKFGL